MDSNVPISCSIIIPTRDRSARLLRTLAAYARMPGVDRAEIIVVDDGSADSTAEDIGRISREFPAPLRLISQAHRGPAAARNAGVRESRGAIVIFTGDDIEPSGDWIRGHLAAHDRSPDESAVVLGKTDPPAGESSRFMNFLTQKSPAQFGYAALDRGSAADFRYFYTSNISLKKSFLVQEPGPFDERFDLAAWEDIDLGYRLMRRGMRIHYCPEILAVHHHSYTLSAFLSRQDRSGQMAYFFLKKHPELESIVFRPDVSFSRRIFRRLPRPATFLLRAAEFVSPGPLADRIYPALLAASFERGFLRARETETATR